MALGHLPSFARLRRESAVFMTDAQARAPALEPWIQWVTVHSGMPASRHAVSRLGGGASLAEPCLAEVLSDAGIRVGVLGSMNLNYARLDGYHLPDLWSEGGATQPTSLRRYHRLVSRGAVRGKSDENRWPRRELFSLGFAALAHGLRPGTAGALAAQLLAERRDRGLRWRRAALLDRMQFDVFQCLNERLGVRFASFFANSTAHYQHYYWRHMSPESFTAPPAAGSHPSLAGAVLHGYRGMDALLARCMRDYPDALLVVCGALGQRPWCESEKVAYYPRELDRLLELAGLSLAQMVVRPVMAEQLHLICESAERAHRVAQRLCALTVGEEPLLYALCEGRRVVAGCRLTRAVEPGETIAGPEGRRSRFDRQFQRIHTARSARHDPLGMLWIRNGRHEVHTRPVPLTDIAPTILSYFGVPAPEHMRGCPLPI